MDDAHSASFTGTSGVNPSPMCRMTLKSYFKDC